MKEDGLSTKLIHDGYAPTQDPYRSVTAPLYLTATYGIDNQEGLEYQRGRNVNAEIFEAKMSAIEDAAFALSFNAGMAAITTTLLTVTEPGDLIVAEADMYGGTRHSLLTTLRQSGRTVEFIDFHDTAAFEAVQTRSPKLFYFETPTNPCLKIIDVAAVSAAAHESGALVMVDNTFATPYFQKPLKLGADLVAESATKYINGHGDALGGVVAVSRRFGDGERLRRRLMSRRLSYGNHLPPLEAYLLCRSLATFPLRMERHSASGRGIAAWLDGQSKIESVTYPGLASHPQHDLAMRQMTGFGGVITCRMKADRAETERFLRSLRLFTVAVSLGAAGSLADHCKFMTQKGFDEPEYARRGITDGTLRLSIGLEDAEDLIADLSQALQEI